MNPQLKVDEICETLRGLPEKQLDEVLHFVHELESAKEITVPSGTAAPLYSIHSLAVKTGIPDLAHQHDHYLYGLEKRDA